MALYDASDLLTDAVLLRRVAREMLGLYDAGAVRRLKEEAGQAARQGDSVSPALGSMSRSWCRICSLNELLRRPRGEAFW